MLPSKQQFDPDTAWRKTGVNIYAIEAVVFCVCGLAWQFARQSISNSSALLDSVLITMLFVSATLCLVFASFLDAPSIHVSHYQLCLTFFLFYLYVFLDDAASTGMRYACPLFGNTSVYQAAGGLTLAFLAVLTLCAAAAARDRLWRSPTWVIGLLVLTTGLHASLKQRLDPSSSLPYAIYIFTSLFALTSSIHSLLDPRLRQVVPSFTTIFNKQTSYWIKGAHAILGVIAVLLSLFAVDRPTWVQMTFLPVAEAFLIAHYFLFPPSLPPARPVSTDTENARKKEVTMAPPSFTTTNTQQQQQSISTSARNYLMPPPYFSPEDMLFGNLAVISHPRPTMKKNM